jgi:hypothetical protein
VLVILIEGLEEIGEYAFHDCRFLRRIVVPDAVKTIKKGSFYSCMGLTHVTLGGGLEEVGEMAFSCCETLEEIVIPNAVKTIQKEAFVDCHRLMSVILGDLLEDIGQMAFGESTSLRSIVIPNAVKTIKYGAFYYCFRLTSVTLGEGLKEICKEAFEECKSLVRIVIPSTVKRIHDTAFKDCYGLMRVKFCDEIEKFVSCKAMQDWWNQRVHERCLGTYCFLVRCSIPERFSGLALVTSWQANIHEMLRSIPTVSAPDDDDDGEDGDEGMNAYFDTIDAKLTEYENLLDEAPTFFPEQFGLDHGIVLEILSFL